MNPWMIPLILIVAGVSLAFAFAYETGSDPVEAIEEWCAANGHPDPKIEEVVVDVDLGSAVVMVGSEQIVLELQRPESKWEVRVREESQ